LQKIQGLYCTNKQAGFASSGICMIMYFLFETEAHIFS